ncbi:unnamed protein product [Didymodactylos carnosus]|uniref:G-protein coupled receptors family 1 profile domain-containing protein n=1 Tax=Didymodactylos carnosus TaxID=1234261 RepID=A0A8S2EE56_9BILA|nr:unnamed protein product [Didymodactylos carnosus]CAF4012888.1 unnamed protein product [Didymodactylos carnosus]
MIDAFVQFLPNELIENTEQYTTFHCYINKILYTVTTLLCLWLSCVVAVERGLIVCLNFKTNATRLRSLVVVLIMIVIAAASSLHLFIYQCNYDVNGGEIIRGVFLYFYTAVGIVLYVIAALLVLISFARRIHEYGNSGESCLKTFFKLLGKHLFIFIPPLVYGFAVLPYTIIINSRRDNQQYLACKITRTVYYIRILILMLTYLPPTLTWLLFVYPSKVYMTEFYMNTRSGQCIFKVLLKFRLLN